MKITRRRVTTHSGSVRLVYLTCNWLERRAIRKLIAAGRSNILDISRYPVGLAKGVHFMIAPKGKVHAGFRLAAPLPKWMTIAAGRRFNWIDMTGLCVSVFTIHPFPITTVVGILGLSIISMILDAKVMRQVGVK